MKMPTLYFNQRWTWVQVIGSPNEQTPSCLLVLSSWHKQHLYRTVQLILIRRFASITLTTFMFCSMLPSIREGMGLKLLLMTSSQFPAFSLPSFSCLVTPAVWVNGPLFHSNRDAGLAFWSDFSLWEELGGRAALCVCLSVCVLGWRCLHAYVSYFVLHELR